MRSAKKTKPRLGARMIEGLTDIRDALKNGERLEEKYTVRTVILDLEPQEYDAEKVKTVRLRLRVSQSIFAQILGASVDTVASWEQGYNTPNPMARRLLDEISRDVERWHNVLRRSMTSVEA